MKFFLGVFLGISVSYAYAQLAPWDAPLEQQLNGMRAEAWIGSQRVLGLRDTLVDSEPLLQTFGAPCRK